MAADSACLMGIVNVTPDSFSDGGKYYDVDKAVDHGIRLLGDGASILDIGGESTRPGAKVVSDDEEIKRVVPVIKSLRERGITCRISVDSRNSKTIMAALDAGADMVNDVSALTHDPRSLPLIAERDVEVCLMHMRGNPENMQQAPHYDDVVKDIIEFLSQRIDACLQAGVREKNIIIDPGIGFGKNVSHNLEILQNIDKFAEMGFPVLLGTSRKSFINAVCKDNSKAGDRLGGSIASVVWGWLNGVRMFRIHDVKETRQALSVIAAIEKS